MGEVKPEDDASPIVGRASPIADISPVPGEDLGVGLSGHPTDQSPLLPPVLETSRTASMTMPFSAAFSMS
jgi:hypothetical protein